MDIMEAASKELDKLEGIGKEISAVSFKDKKKVQALYSKQKHLMDIKDVYDSYSDNSKQIIENEKLLSDLELKELAAEEIKSLKKQNDILNKKLKLLLKPKDPNESRDIVVEIRAGAGGAEASLFVGEYYTECMIRVFHKDHNTLKSKLVNSYRT